MSALGSGGASAGDSVQGPAVQARTQRRQVASDRREVRIWRECTDDGSCAITHLAGTIRPGIPETLLGADPVGTSDSQLLHHGRDTNGVTQ